MKSRKIQTILRKRYDYKEGQLLNKKTAKPISSYVNKKGFLQARTYLFGNLVHRLIYMYFYGDIPIKKKIKHKNGNKLDNRIENLEIALKRKKIKYKKGASIQQGLKDTYTYKSGELLEDGVPIAQGRLIKGFRNLSKNGTTYFLHRLIWIYFNGGIPEAKQVNHIDGDKLNNKIENLELVDYGYRSTKTNKRKKEEVFLRRIGHLK